MLFPGISYSLSVWQTLLANVVIQPVGPVHRKTLAAIVAFATKLLLPGERTPFPLLLIICPRFFASVHLRQMVFGGGSAARTVHASEKHACTCLLNPILLGMHHRLIHSILRTTRNGRLLAIGIPYLTPMLGLLLPHFLFMFSMIINLYVISSLNIL